MLNKKLKKIYTLISILLIVSFFMTTISSNIYAKTSEKEKVTNQDSDVYVDHIGMIINWKKDSIGTLEKDPLLNSSFLENAGDTTGDWYPIGIGRIGYPDDYEAYLAVIGDNVSQRYKTKDKLSKTKSTEWHRISLAILAMGGDPTQIGRDESGHSIDLIADGTYNRGKTNSLGKQGINGWIFGLITLDSMRYEVPKDAYNTRDDIIQKILELQLHDGGFSFQAETADPDITAMAIQALAPYYNSEQIYTYKQKVSGKTVTKKVRQVIDESLAVLSKLQLEDGDYESWGAKNVESTAQVLVALTSLGIDPAHDERFIKNENTLINGILKYHQNDGGFIHSEKYDVDNPTSLPDESNSMASEQVLYALISLKRYYGNYRTLYDFREEMDQDLKKEIMSLEQSIESLPDSITEKDKEVVEELFQKYLNIPISERSYVFHYYKLAESMGKLGIENNSESIAKNIGVTKHGNGSITPIFDKQKVIIEELVFSEEDANEVKQIPDKVTTEHYVEVVKLIKKLETAKNKDEYIYALDELNMKKEKIERIKAEIELLNRDILDQLYPFSELSIKDKENVENIVSRFEQLSPYDQKKVLGHEDIKKSKTQIDNLIRARIITIVIIMLIFVIITTIILRARKRKKEKMKQKMLLVDERDCD
ncbi:hypothetical protein [Massilibacterium senegalense]|uniref:hypothetical protein n=1 Tax=Massilibacterium senegalense TaxID=1632858 RepID=UPI0007861C4F|nr:hypothetical protein [Massilibacterium senegalense]